jgi:biofilm PGA synthesis N-glycosyltransferase PgaC
MIVPLATVLSRWRHRSNCWAGRLLLAGLIGGLAFNLSRWPRDVARARALRRASSAEFKGLVSSPPVSVLVAAWNERDVIEQHINSVRELRYPNVEHIICAGGKDGTYELVQSLGREGLTLLRQHPGQGKAHSLAKCLEVASGSVAVLTDADALLDDTTFERLLLPIVQDGAQVATGPFRPVPEQLENAFVVHRWSATTYRLLQAGRYVQGLVGANTVFTTTTLRETRALNEAVWIGEDIHLAKRVVERGYRIRFAELSEMAVRFEEHFGSYARQRSRWLGGILVHALPRRDWSQIAVVAVFYLVGQAFVWLPAMIPFLGRSVMAIWGAGIACAVLNRLRYLTFTSMRTGQPLALSTYLLSVVLVPGDLLALAYAPIDLLMRLRTRRW